MSENIVIVTNEESFVDRIFAQLYSLYPNDITRIKNEIVTGDVAYWAKWIGNDDNGNPITMGTPIINEKKYNVIAIPFAGFAYYVAYGRKYGVENKSVIVSIKEKYPTQVYSLDLFHLYINSGTKIKLSVFEDYLNSMIGNSITGMLFDPVIELIENDKIPQESSDLKSLIT